MSLPRPHIPERGARYRENAPGPGPDREGRRPRSGVRSASPRRALGDPRWFAIDGGERLVEQDQLCILHGEPSKEDALELADGKRFDRPSFEPFETNASKCFARRFAHRP